MEDDKMTTKARWVFSIGFFLLAASVFAGADQERVYPSHSIELVVPSGAGGGQDVLCRVIQPMLEKELGVSIRVSNVSGGAHTKGIIYSYSAPADGYVIHCESPSGIIADIFKKMPFRFQDEFVPIARLNKDIGVLWIGKNGRFKDVQEMIAYGKENPGKVTIAIASPGGVDDAGLGLFGNRAGVEFAFVPIESGGERMASVIGGHVDFMYEEVSAVGDMIKSGDLKPVVVLRDERINTPDLKDTPSAGELGITGMEALAGTFRFFAVRKGTPQEIVDKLVTVFRKIYDSPEYQKWSEENVLNLIPGWMGPQELKKLWDDTNREYTAVFTQLGRL
jgi:tripartite-type tricarboxylate transporter receptor subunit TctC